MAISAPDIPADTDIDYCLSEFEELDRRRLFGSPALDVSEVEYWLELRARLEEHFAGGAALAPSEDWSGIERREFIRLPTHIRIQLSEPVEREARVARDISQGGLFIATRRPLPVGSELRLQMEESSSGCVEIRGMVAWVQEKSSPERAAGMGIRFGELSFAQRRAISRFVQDAVFDD